MVSLREIIMLGISFIVGIISVFIKIMYNSVESDNSQIGALNGMLVFFQALVFVLMIICVVMLVKICISSLRFVITYNNNQYGKINKFAEAPGVDALRKSFENSGQIWNLADIFFVMIVINIAATIFGSFFDGFKGFEVWQGGYSDGIQYTLFHFWLQKALVDDPLHNMSAYAINWQLPTLIIVLLLRIFTHSQFEKAKKAYYSTFSTLGGESFFSRSVGMGKRNANSKPSDRFFSIDYSQVEKKDMLYQEDLDKQEGNFFATHQKPSVIQDINGDEPAKETPSFVEAEELVPTEEELGGLDLAGEKKGEDLTPCPICGSLNDANAEECSFCGASMKAEITK